MKERPILFSSSMALALLAGTKTQTRRIVKPQPEHHWSSLPGYRLDMTPQPVDGGLAVRPVHSIPTRPFDDSSPRSTDLSPWVPCPYGAPGDRLWVKETWRPVLRTRAVERIRYAADGALQIKTRGRGWKRPKAARTGNVSPLFMPRWASRITLEVTGVRIERLQAISEEDAVAEGIERVRGDLFGVEGEWTTPFPSDSSAESGACVALTSRSAALRCSTR